METRARNKEPMTEATHIAPLSTVRHDPHSFEAMLTTFGFTSEKDFISWLNALTLKNKEALNKESIAHNIPTDLNVCTFPHGKELYDALFNKRADELALKGEQRDDFRRILDHNFHTDNITHGLGKEWDNFLLKAFDAYAFEHPEAHPAVMELDFSNMGGANLAIGREPVNRAISLIASMYEYELHQKNANFTMIRRGGDELRFYITGASEEDLHDAIHRAETHVQQLVSALDIGKLQHLKDDKKQQPERAGFGAGAHVVMVDRLTFDHGLEDTLGKALDDGIKARKLAIGKTNGVLSEDLIDPNTFHATHSAEMIQKTLNAQELAMTKCFPHLISPSSTPIMFESLHEEVASHHGDYYAAREAIAARQDGTPEQKAFLTSAVALTNSYDPTTGLKSNKGLLEALPFFQQQAAKAKEQGTLPPNITLFEITNLGGMNDLLGHHDTDQVIASLAQHAADIISERYPHARAQLYSFGGSRFCWISEGIPPKQLQTVCEHVSQDIFTQFQEKQAAYGLNPHILDNAINKKRVITDNKGQTHIEKGVSLIYANLPMMSDPDLKPEAHLQILEELSDSFSREPHKLKIIQDVGIETDNPLCFIGNSNDGTVHAVTPSLFLEHAKNGNRVPAEAVARLLADGQKPKNHVYDIDYIIPTRENPAPSPIPDSYIQRMTERSKTPNSTTR